MKNHIVLMSCAFLLVLLSTQAARGKEVKTFSEEDASKKVNAKCHVSLIDGTEAIVFWRTQHKHISKLSNRIVGKKTLTQKSLEKIKIYRAFECVLEEDEFTKLKAQSLDDKTPR